MVLAKGGTVNTRKSSSRGGWMDSTRGGLRTRRAAALSAAGAPFSVLRRGAEVPLERIVRSVETALISYCLQQAPSFGAAARALGLTREALSVKMRELGLGAPE